MLQQKFSKVNVTDNVMLEKGAVVRSLNPNGSISSNSPTFEVVSAARTLLASESGKTVFLNSATEFITTLPLPALGARFTFIVTAAPSGAAYTVVTSGSSNIVKGSVVTSGTAVADFEVSGGDTITFADGVAVAGDKVELVSDGTNWFAYGVCSAATAITITTAS